MNIWEMISRQYQNQLNQGKFLDEPTLSEDSSPIAGMSPSELADVEAQMNPMSKYKRNLGPSQMPSDVMPGKNPWAIKGRE